MRVLHFGRIRKIEKGTVSEYALHIQCPWRIEGPEGIVTGRSDLWEPAEDSPDIDWGDLGLGGEREPPGPANRRDIEGL